MLFHSFQSQILPLKVWDNNHHSVALKKSNPVSNDRAGEFSAVSQLKCPLSCTNHCCPREMKSFRYQGQNTRINAVANHVTFHWKGTGEKRHHWPTISSGWWSYITQSNPYFPEITIILDCKMTTRSMNLYFMLKITSLRSVCLFCDFKETTCRRVRRSTVSKQSKSFLMINKHLWSSLHQYCYFWNSKYELCKQPDYTFLFSGNKCQLIWYQVQQDIIVYVWSLSHS